MDTLWQDFRFAFRTLRRTPTVTLVAVVSLTLAIAGNAIVFSLINGMLFRPLPFEEPDRIAIIGEYQRPIQAGTITTTSPANFFDWQERQTSFSELGAYSSEPVNVGAESRGEPVTLARVTPSFLRVLGVRTETGRSFLPEEGIPGQEKVVILTHAFWQQRFGAAGADRAGAGRDVTGEALTLNGEAHTIVGVLPEDFEFLDPNVRLWAPLALDRSEASRSGRPLLVAGRLKPGVTTEGAHAEMAALGQVLAEEYPEANRGYTTQAINLREQVPDARNRQLFGLLQGALLFVLLIACANIANLLLARTQSRVTEMAVRASLGAGRGRILRQLATESLLTAGLGGLLGLGLGVGGIRVMASALAQQLPSYWLPVLDSRVVLFTAGVTVLAALLCTLAPALQIRKLRVATALKEGGRGASLGGRRRLAAKTLVVAEIAMALVLIGGASVLIRSFLSLQNTDPGFEISDMLTVAVTLPEAAYPEPVDRAAAIEELARRLEALPGADSVAVANTYARSPFLGPTNFTVDAAPPAQDEAPPSAFRVAASSSFFDNVGIPLLQGRLFDSRDRASSVPVVVINQSLAKRFWPDSDPVGQRITVNDTSRTILGVVGNAGHSLFVNDSAQAAFYVPIAQEPPAGMVFSLRAEGDLASLGNPAREAILGFDSNLVVTQVQTLEDFLAQFYVGIQIFTTILGGFGILALFLAALGTYGVLAFSVAQRSHEIGVRMAIGARRGQVMRMVTGQGLLLGAIGLAIGGPGVYVVTRVIGSLLSDFVAVEPVTVLAVAAILAVVILAASILPARRAASVDPVVALRGE